MQFIVVTLCVLDHESSLPSHIGLETEREKELRQQLKQANDTAARLQDELRQAEDRERELQMELDGMKNAMSKLQLHIRTVLTARLRFSGCLLDSQAPVVHILCILQ